MLKIAKEVDEIKKRPWFKRLDAEEQNIMIKKMTVPQEGERAQMNVKSQNGTSTGEVPIWHITTTFKAINIDKIKDNQTIQEELKEHITTICREHSISKMTIYFEEHPAGGGGRPVMATGPIPQIS